MSFTSPPGLTASRWSDVYIAAISRAVSYAGDFVAATALVLALQARDSSSGYAVAAILLAATLPPVVLAPLTGRLADRVDSRLLLAVTAAGQAVVCVALAYTGGTVPIVILAALLGCGVAVTQPTLSALTPSMVVRDDLAKASAIGQTGNSVAMVVAPAVGGLLVGAYGLRVPILVDAVSYLALVVAAFAIRTRRGGRAGRAAESGADGSPAVWRMRSDRLAFPLVVVIGAVVGVLNVFAVADIFFVRGTLHASTTMYGIIDGAYAATTLVGAWLVTRRADRPDNWLAGLTLGLFAGISAIVALASTVPNVWWLMALWTVGGITNGGFNVTLAVLLGRRVPAEVRGHAYAVFGAVANGAGGLGLLLGGALIGLAAPRLLIAASGLAGVLAVAVFAPPVLAEMRRTRTAPAGVEPAPVSVSP
ncbi:MAG TPA: MFS transporter [Micromonosporaceae bacterium]|nr:MFS transporter [Micromonosporaceae bacterium]